MTKERRLIVRKITLENFKSYAGITEIGPFHKVFSFFLTLELLQCGGSQRFRKVQPHRVPPLCFRQAR